MGVRRRYGKARDRSVRGGETLMNGRKCRIEFDDYAQI